MSTVREYICISIEAEDQIFHGNRIPSVVSGVKASFKGMGPETLELRVTNGLYKVGDIIRVTIEKTEEPTLLLDFVTARCYPPPENKERSP